MKFRMVDRILDWEPGRRIRGVKTVSLEEYQLPAPLGDGARLPQSLVVESLVQLGSWLVTLSSDFAQLARVVEIQETRFHGVVGPAHRLLLEADVRADSDGELTFDGKALLHDRLAAEVLGCRLAKDRLSDYHDPDDLRVLFSEIHRPEKP